MGQLFGAGPVIPLVRISAPAPSPRDFRDAWHSSRWRAPLHRGQEQDDSADRRTAENFRAQLHDSQARAGSEESIISTRKQTRSVRSRSASPPIAKSAKRTPASWSSAIPQFAANPVVSQQRNGDLFFNAIDWLAQDEKLISIRPKSPTNRRVNLSEAQSAALHWLDLVFLPGLVLFSGVYIWWKRR